jgi:hypothetical protein
MKEARKGFFFEKKKQKTFFNLGRGLLRLHVPVPSWPDLIRPSTPSSNTLTPRLSHQHGAEEQKFFCCFFFKKSSAYFLKTATP